MKKLEIGKYYKHTDNYELEGDISTYFFVCAADAEEYICATSDVYGNEWQQILNENIDTYYISKCVEITEEEFTAHLLENYKADRIYKAEYSLKAKKSKLAAKDNADLLEMFGEIYN